MKLQSKIGEAQLNLRVEGQGRIWTQDVTPQQAKLMLTHQHPGQRPLRNSHVAAMSRAMQEGRFVWTAEAIKFDLAGRLIDGQHRLSAVVLSGVVLRNALLATVEDDRASLYIDTVVKPRSIPDLRSFMGQSKLEPSIMAAVVLDFVDFNQTDRDLLSKPERNELAEQCPQIAQITRLYRVGVKVGVTSAVLGAALRCVRANEERAMAFFEAAFNNTATVDGAPCEQARVLADWLVHEALVRRGRDRGRKTSARVAAYKTIASYNAWREGRLLHRLQPPKADIIPEPLP